MSRDFLADENELGLGGLERLQIPASGNEIKKLHSLRETDKAFRSMHARGQAVRETFETIMHKFFIGRERERLELRLMFVLRRRHLSLPPDPEQQLGVDLAALGANKRCTGVNFVQFRF